MIRIRPSRPLDADRSIAIWRAAVDATHHFLSQDDRRAIDREVRAFLPATPLWLAVNENDQAIAFMGLTGASMDALFVHPDHHRTGVGRMLVRHAMSTEPILTTTVNEQNASAMRFYASLGFVRTGRSDLDEQGRPYPLLHLRIDSTAHHSDTKR